MAKCALQFVPGLLKMAPDAQPSAKTPKEKEAPEEPPKERKRKQKDAPW